MVKIWIAPAAIITIISCILGQTPVVSSFQTRYHLRLSSTRSPFVLRSQETDADQEKSTGTASIPTLSVSLIKSVVGSGVLALPAGVATLGDSPSGVVVPAVLLILVIGASNAYFFSLIGRVCSMTGATSFRDAWERSVGTGSSSQLVSAVCSAKAGIGCLAYSMILADSFQSIAVGAGLTDFTRTESLGLVTLAALLPLCLKRDLTSLAPFSLLGVVGMGFTTSAMVVRYIDGSYTAGGQFLNQISPQFYPSFGQIGPELSTIFACTLGTAFVAHYNGKSVVDIV
jgi:amino acid permease